MMGSCTKAFTATAIMICKEHGLFGDLKTELMCDYLEPEITCPDAWRAITLYDLLTMSSGLPDVSEYNEGIATMVTFSTQELIEFTGTMPMHTEPGTAYEYNNTNYLILGYILERVTGSSYEAFLKEEIFRPFGMDETGAYKQDEIVPLMASGYQLEGNSLDTTLLKAEYYPVSYTIATGNLYTTIDDFHRWSRVLVDPVIISSASLEEMLTPREGIANASGYAYGWVAAERYGQPCILYAGAVNGFNSAILHFRESDVTILVLRNRKPLSVQDDVLRSIALDIAGIIFTGAVPE